MSWCLYLFNIICFPAFRTSESDGFSSAPGIDWGTAVDPLHCNENMLEDGNLFRMKHPKIITHLNTIPFKEVGVLSFTRRESGRDLIHWNLQLWGRILLHSTSQNHRVMLSSTTSKFEIHQQPVHVCPCLLPLSARSLRQSFHHWMQHRLERCRLARPPPQRKQIRSRPLARPLKAILSRWTLWH